MEYPKAVMNLSELKRMGFPESDLLGIFHSHGQKIAWRSGNHKQSRILFDTAELEKYRIACCKANNK